MKKFLVLTGAAIGAVLFIKFIGAPILMSTKTPASDTPPEDHTFDEPWS